MRRAVPLIVGLWLLAGGGSAWAKLCGDDVGGQDVPCACGDIVVSNLSLMDDPVAVDVCEGDGLVVRAAEASAGVTIDLHGKRLRGGDTGAGIWIVDGGPGGARIISSGGRGAIEGFRDGIVGRGPRSVARLENVDLRASRRDGVRVHGDSYEILGVDVEGAGRDAFSLDGRDYRCHGSRASRSGRFGFLVNGDNALVGRTLAPNVAEDAGSDGFHLMGARHRLNACTARRNRKDGVSLRGSTFEVSACTASANGGDGIWGEGAELDLIGNRADGNGRNGLIVSGLRLVDSGGNQGNGNRGEGQQRAAIQCEIGGIPCRP